MDLSPQRSQAVNFWLMLALSSIVATVGIIADSTPTAISTVITAPLSTPTMGIALQSV
ncbi:hypothetical protein [Actinacidiphila sp. bgisy160]|uniref:hypothetical protein n=1 Tax=Actinacidiphila sp. bgisy160 TaxID=3413796 RepID=UPI003D757F48